MNRSLVAMLLGTFVLRTSTAITGGMLIFYVDTLTRTTRTGPNDIGILHGGFYATEVVGAIVFGIMADRIGRKRIMLLGPIFGAVAVAMTAFTARVHILFVTRLLEGSSTAASVPSTLGFLAAETANDNRVRGQAAAIFELVSLGGLFAVGPALAGFMWEAWGRPAFLVNCGLYMVALLLYGYGVVEVRRLPAEAPETQGAPGLRRFAQIATSRRVLLFAPTWLAIVAVLGIWGSQGLLLLRGNVHDPAQFLMRGIDAKWLGLGQAALALVFGAGLLFWGNLYARFRPSTMILWGVVGFAAITADIFLINHLGESRPILLGLTAVALVSLFVMSAATPAALGLLAGVSEEFHQDRSAIMGLYTVIMGIGMVISAVVGKFAAEWKGIDGLVVASAALTGIGMIALVNLRRHEHLVAAAAGSGSPAFSIPAALPGPHRESLLKEER